MRQLQTETREFIAIVLKTNPIVFFMFISLLFDFMYQRGYQKEYFGD